MATADVVMYDEEFNQIKTIISKLRVDATAKLVFLVDKNGQQIAAPGDVAARGAMLLGAHLAGVAIEQSMLGATHACANPLTARYGTTHGIAIAIMLPHVVRWNSKDVWERYARLLGDDGAPETSGTRLADRLVTLRSVGSLPVSLSEMGVSQTELGPLADDAATQWTGTFNESLQRDLI